jgi:predicted nucleotidyltransferase
LAPRRQERPTAPREKAEVVGSRGFKQSLMQVVLYFYSMNLLDLYADDIKALCLKYKVKKLSAFGSLVKGNFNEESDIDLIVDFEPLSNREYKENYFNLLFALEDKFCRPVDLLEESQLKNPYFKQNVESHQKLIYAS